MPKVTVFDIKELYKTYGEHDFFNSPKFNHYTRNLRTGSVLAQNHHCKTCGSALQMECFLKGHYFYCAEWVTGPGGESYRCGQRFSKHSGGCGTHKRCHGPSLNALLIKWESGQGEVTIEMFDDPQAVSAEETAVQRQEKKKQFFDAVNGKWNPEAIRIAKKQAHEYHKNMKELMENETPGKNKKGGKSGQNGTFRTVTDLPVPKMFVDGKQFENPFITKTNMDNLTFVPDEMKSYRCGRSFWKGK
ncbi:hypothetical protein BS50DRAFT_583394 [Corynespora cassiicola Philippines]|uniref:Uncharacterized protein n=1 Tax=Corynespora cassiicola Philippines TaxID=1448308 RepID=A0A2T2P298_CORCC|nr:hypothetical protein BS50DRAFT_583394 [Corynespora cassiicola Philippines]